MLNQHIKAFVFGNYVEIGLWVTLNHLPQIARNVKIQRVGTNPRNLHVFGANTKRL